MAAASGAITLNRGFVDGGESPKEKSRKMRETLKSILDEIPRSEDLRFHYTDAKIAELIANGGFRSSDIGLGGRGVYFSEVSPVSDEAAAWPDEEFKTKILKMNYANDWNSPARANCANAVIVVAAPKRMTAEVPYREGAHVVRTADLGPGADLKHLIKAVWLLYGEGGNRIHKSGGYPALAQAAFEEHPTRGELTDNRRLIVGPDDDDGWSAATTVRLGGGDATVAFELMKKGRFAPFGVLRPGADRDIGLGYQQGGVGLHTGGYFWVDGSRKRNDLPSISEGRRVVLEWRGGAQTLAWVVDGERVLEHQGDFAGYDIAVGGYRNATIQLVEAA